MKMPESADFPHEIPCFPVFSGFFRCELRHGTAPLSPLGCPPADDARSRKKPRRPGRRGLAGSGKPGVFPMPLTVPAGPGVGLAGDRAGAGAAADPTAQEPEGSAVHPVSVNLILYWRLSQEGVPSGRLSATGVQKTAAFSARKEFSQSVGLKIINERQISGYRKVLKRFRNIACSAIPLDSWAAGESRTVRRIKARKQLFPRQCFSRLLE